MTPLAVSVPPFKEIEPDPLKVPVLSENAPMDRESPAVDKAMLTKEFAGETLSITVADPVPIVTVSAVACCPG
jgi:hypothetical protein